MPPMGPLSASDFFAAGHLMTGGGPRPTPGGTDYDSTAMRYPRSTGWGVNQLFRLGAPRARAMAPDISVGYRIIQPLTPLPQLVFAKTRNQTGPNFGTTMQIGASIITPPLTKISG